MIYYSSLFKVKCLIYIIKWFKTKIGRVTQQILVFSCWLDMREIIIIYNDMAEKVSKMNGIVLSSVMTI